MCLLQIMFCNDSGSGSGMIGGGEYLCDLVDMDQENGTSSMTRPVNITRHSVNGITSLEIAGEASLETYQVVAQGFTCKILCHYNI